MRKCLRTVYFLAVVLLLNSKKDLKFLVNGTLLNDEALVVSRLNDNIVGNCLTKIVNSVSASSLSSTKLSVQESIPVKLFPPSQHEVTSYINTIDTLTRANPELAGGLVLGKSRVPAFMIGNNWQLPADHVRQNKTLCVSAATRAGEEG
jgi:hypothetical protein